MKLSEMKELIDQIIEEVGDLEVGVTNKNGEFDTNAEFVVNDGDHPTMVIFLDSVTADELASELLEDEEELH